MDFTVLKAKSNLSSLLRRVESGESIFIRRGRKGPRFRVVLEEDERKRSLMASPGWKGKVRYDDKAIWESEWSDES